MIRDSKSIGRLKLFLILIPFIAGGCSALQPTDTGGPRANQPPYPVMLSEDAARREQSMVMWQRLAQSAGVPQRTEVGLHPYTSTIEILPPNAGLTLPKIGTNPIMNEEETRESLRRFIRDWQGLIGADPNQLSLVERTDQADGSKLARYEQRAFRYPLRGEYGSLRIRFAPDRRVLEFLSTCIPNADRLQSALAAITPQLNAEDASKRVVNMSVPYPTAQAQQSTYQLSATNQADARQLVIYVRNPGAVGDSPELHLAWEIAITNAPFKFIYLDAVKGEVVGTS